MKRLKNLLFVSLVAISGLNVAYSRMAEQDKLRLDYASDQVEHFKKEIKAKEGQKKEIYSKISKENSGADVFKKEIEKINEKLVKDIEGLSYFQNEARFYSKSYELDKIKDLKEGSLRKERLKNNIEAKYSFNEIKEKDFITKKKMMIFEENKTFFKVQKQRIEENRKKEVGLVENEKNKIEKREKKVLEEIAIANKKLGNIHRHQVAAISEAMPIARKIERLGGDVKEYAKVGPSTNSDDSDSKIAQFGKKYRQVMQKPMIERNSNLFRKNVNVAQLDKINNEKVDLNLKIGEINKGYEERQNQLEGVRQGVVYTDSVNKQRALVETSENLLGKYQQERSKIYGGIFGKVKLAYDRYLGKGEKQIKIDKKEGEATYSQEQINPGEQINPKRTSITKGPSIRVAMPSISAEEIQKTTDKIKEKGKEKEMSDLEVIDALLEKHNRTVESELDDLDDFVNSNSTKVDAALDDLDDFVDNNSAVTSYRPMPSDCKKQGLVELWIKGVKRIFSNKKNSEKVLAIDIFSACSNAILKLDPSFYQTEGILRISASNDELNRAQKELFSGKIGCEKWVAENSQRPHLIAHMLKRLIKESIEQDRGLKSSLSNLFRELRGNSDEKNIKSNLFRWIADAGNKSYIDKMIQPLFEILYKIEARKESNKMGFENISTVITPNLVSNDSNDSAVSLAETLLNNDVMNKILESKPVFFQ